MDPIRNTNKAHKLCSTHIYYIKYFWKLLFIQVEKLLFTMKKYAYIT